MWHSRQVLTEVRQASGSLVARASVGAVAAVGLLGQPLERWAPLLLVVAGVLGLPHGAVDALVLRLEGPGARRAVALYALAAAAATVVAVVAPVPAVLALLGLSVLHFAEGEVGFARLRGQDRSPVTALGVGLGVVVLPLVLRLDQSRSLLSALDPALPGVVADVRTPLLAVTALVVAVGLVAARHDRPGALELLVVTSACLLGPGVVVFAVWFACWHAPRHLARVGALAPARALATAAAAPTLLAVVGLAGLALWLGGLPSAVLVVLLGLTVPHAAVVARMSLRSA